jgi:hypothetical protein
MCLMLVHYPKYLNLPGRSHIFLISIVYIMYYQEREFYENPNTDACLTVIYSIAIFIFI